VLASILVLATAATVFAGGDGGPFPHWSLRSEPCFGYLARAGPVLGLTISRRF